MLRANQREYQKSYLKHYHTYANCDDNSKISYISRSLILVYCVESGLKYVLMKTQRVDNIDKARDDLKQLLMSHDYERLLTSIPKCAISRYRFPPFYTKHGDLIRANNYHQMLRYAILTDDQDALRKYNEQLKGIADWLNEKVKEYGIQ